VERKVGWFRWIVELLNNPNLLNNLRDLDHTVKG